MDYPTGSGNKVNLLHISQDLCRRVANIFLPDENGRRPCHGDSEMYSSDPFWKELVLFYEYFDGDSGRGCGARYKRYAPAMIANSCFHFPSLSCSHQTGWTALAARCIEKMVKVSLDTFNVFH